jgi:hypothetical protein
MDSSAQRLTLRLAPTAGFNCYLYAGRKDGKYAVSLNIVSVLCHLLHSGCNAVTLTRYEL